MNKIFKLFMLAVVVLGFSSCYNEFEEPAPAKVWTKADFADSKLISIKDFKQLFYKEYGNGACRNQIFGISRQRRTGRIKERNYGKCYGC